MIARLARRRAARTALAAPRFPPRRHPALARAEYRVDRERLADQIALGKLAAKLAQARELVRRFDALGNHVATQGAGHRNDGAHDGQAARIVELPHEGLVELERVEVEPVQVAQARVARAEIVE